jgi:formylglycine-generating enzyme required for sulfatase activity/serine/threonine protein kinase
MSRERHQRAKELFLAACELDAREAAAFLQRECGADAELRREVEELLGVDTAGVSVLDKQVSGVGGPARAEAARIPAEELARLAARSAARSYELGDELGRGGMGRVLRARDIDLCRELALKISLGGAHGGTTDDAARFIEEARVTARLDHPGIVPVHDLGLDADGQPFFAMKLVQGRELGEVMGLARANARGWSTTRVVGALLKVCEAVAYAHTKGVVHRDLKPANVMVGDYGEVYVMDWGISRVLGDEREGATILHHTSCDAAASDGAQAQSSSALTRAGSILGTPYGMPPEQARGEPVGPAADIYAVGAMLYQALAGRRPYEMPGVSVAASAVLLRVLQGPPEPLRRLAPRAPAELVAITERAMARRADDRYHDLRALAEDLRAYLEGRVVRAHRTGALAELRKWIARNRLAAAGLAGALFAVVAGLAWSRQLEATSKRELDLASDYFRARVARDSADELWPAAPANISALEGWVARVEALLARRALHAERLRRLESSPLVDPTELGRQRALGEYFDELDGRGAAEVGLLASVRARLEFASTIEERSMRAPDVAERWRAASASILAGDTHAAYEGLALAPQLGLVPLGADPASGLHEFAHLETGVPATRDALGRIQMRPETGVVFVLVPGGTFHLGASADEGPNHDPEADQNERPVRALTLRPFFLSKFELTQAQWQHVTGANPSHWPAGSEPELTPTNPVEEVSWNEAQAVLGRMGLVLPSEARWEYAGRAGTDTPFVVSVGELARFVNVADERYQSVFHPTYAVEPFDDGFGYHAPVGSLAPNPYGLHDMLGNVFEWTLDVYASYTLPRSSVDGTCLASEGEVRDGWWSPDYRVIRGGSFELPTHYARVSHRVNFAPSTISHSVGVRPAREVH